VGFPIDASFRNQSLVSTAAAGLLEIERGKVECMGRESAAAKQTLFGLRLLIDLRN
jgi:hypothetical protein